MAITAAPRLLTRSTVRLVSVVVPDWDMAITSVSDMSRRRPKPDSSVAGRARAVTAPPARDPRAAARLSQATAAVPWPTASTRFTDPDRSESRRRSGMISGPSDTRGPAAVSAILPRRVLRNESGAWVSSLSR